MKTSYYVKLSCVKSKDRAVDSTSGNNVLLTHSETSLITVLWAKHKKCKHIFLSSFQTFVQIQTNHMCLNNNATKICSAITR